MIRRSRIISMPYLLWFPQKDHAVFGNRNIHTEIAVKSLFKNHNSSKENNFFMHLFEF